MERVKKPVARRWLYAYLGLCLFSILGTVASKLGHIDPGPIGSISSLCLILAGAFCLAAYYREARILLGVLVFCTIAELVGVLTGFPFGQYHYTDVWWPVVPLGSHGYFPLILPFAWLLVAGASHHWVSSRFSGWLAVVLTGVLAAAFDFQMEKIMVKIFQYWKWDTPVLSNGAPLSNAFGWFGVGCVVSLIFSWIKPTPEASRDVFPYGAAILLGFLWVLYVSDVLAPGKSVILMLVPLLLAGLIVFVQWPQFRDL